MRSMCQQATHAAAPAELPCSAAAAAHCCCPCCGVNRFDACLTELARASAAAAAAAGKFVLFTCLQHASPPKRCNQQVQWADTTTLQRCCRCRCCCHRRAAAAVGNQCLRSPPPSSPPAHAMCNQQVHWTNTTTLLRCSCCCLLCWWYLLHNNHLRAGGGSAPGGGGVVGEPGVQPRAEAANLHAGQKQRVRADTADPHRIEGKSSKLLWKSRQKQQINILFRAEAFALATE